MRRTKKWVEPNWRMHSEYHPCCLWRNREKILRFFAPLRPLETDRNLWWIVCRISASAGDSHSLRGWPCGLDFFTRGIAAGRGIPVLLGTPLWRAVDLKTSKGVAYGFIDVINLLRASVRVIFFLTLQNRGKPDEKSCPPISMVKVAKSWQKSNMSY